MTASGHKRTFALQKVCFASSTNFSRAGIQASLIV